MQTKQNYFVNISTALLGLGLASGCQHTTSTPNARGQDFDQPGVATSVDRVNDAQTIKGAAADATLYDRQFDGVLLNSLGRTKLDLMMKGTSVNKPLVVYLDMSQDTAQGREVAITEYLKNSGVDDSALKIVVGPNPNMTTPTAYNLAEIYKAESGTMTGEAADATVAAPAGASSIGSK